MKQYQLKNGDKIPALGLGTWRSEPGKVYEAVKYAIEIGYRHIDCAPIYGNEPEIGKALKEVITSGLVKRSELWITSKLWNNAHAENEVIPALEKTLADLQLEYLDLFLIHWPVAFQKGVIMPQKGEEYQSLEEAPLSETWKGMENGLEKGLCKHIGISNFSESKSEAIAKNAKHKPEVNQVESHPYLQQKSLLSYCNSQGILLTAYSPLGSGSNGKMNLLKDKDIQEIAASKNLSTPQVLIAWAINRDTVVIPKSVTPERIKENFAASTVELTPEEMEAIAALDKNYRFVDGSFWATPGSPYTVESLWA